MPLMGSTKSAVATGGGGGGPGLYEFLTEAELAQYYNVIKTELKVGNTGQLKYVSEEDLLGVGMSRPEVRRLKKYFQKHFPSNVLAKMKKKLLSSTSSYSSRGGGDDGGGGPSVSSVPSLPSKASSTYSRVVAPGRHIITPESIVVHKTLGSGEFGTVQQGVWTDLHGSRIQVAIKALSPERMEKNNPVEFLKEAAIMHAVDHEAIVRLYGVVLDTTSLMLVTELAPLRSLLECLKEPSIRANHLSVPTLFDFSVQICTGMEYLESKRLIHRDLAARNILVFSRTKVKISDFGLSRALGVGKDYYQTNFNVNLKLPIAWCAPECINFLRFTSASDVFAFGVTLWEIFSYGFQPWAALTGQQILEAIDEPNYQRLEKPECCPHDLYYQIMLKCWQHDPSARPTFADLCTELLEYKPEQVQAIREAGRSSSWSLMSLGGGGGRRETCLEFEAGEVICVLDKQPTRNSEESSTSAPAAGNLVWKGVLKDGRSGLFNPSDTITYLGSSFPTVKKGTFTRNEAKSSSLRKGKIRADMISGPQGDLKHTGHVGPDGMFFGDLAFLGTKSSWVPRQVVPPYKPESSSSSHNGPFEFQQHPSSDFTTTTPRSTKGRHEVGGGDLMMMGSSSDTAPLLSTASQMHMDDGGEEGHEYHEISDEENERLHNNSSSMSRNHRELGMSNPALSTKSQSPLESPRFEVHKSFDLGGPSLIDEVFGALSQQQQASDESHNVKNELKEEMSRSKKKLATVKPISSSDRKTLDHAITLANELASRSMLDLDRSGKLSGHSLDDISSPRTPNSPHHKRKFSFILGGGKSSNEGRERRNYSQEAASIPDIQSTLTEEAKEAYNSLVQKPSLGALGILTPSFENKSSSFNYPEKSSCASKTSEFFELELEPHQKKSHPQPLESYPYHPSGIIRKQKPRNLSLPDERMVMELEEERRQRQNEEIEVESNPLRLLRQTKFGGPNNVLPLPPRDRGKGGGGGGGSSSSSSWGDQFPRHQRKHPLLIPSKIVTSASPQLSESSSSSSMPPPPPPKPIRQQFKTTEEEEGKGINQKSTDYVEMTNSDLNGNNNPNPSSSSSDFYRMNDISSVIESLRRRGNNNGEEEVVKLYENFGPLEEEEKKDVVVEEEEPLKPRIPRSDRGSSSREEGMESGAQTSSSVQNNNGDFEPTFGTEKQLQLLKSVRRVMGTLVPDEDMKWAIHQTGDAAHAVKLLRLRGLLPEPLFVGNVERVLSVLEMSHWDVTRASAFLLQEDTTTTTGGSSSSTSFLRTRPANLLRHKDYFEMGQSSSESLSEKTHHHWL